MTENLKNVPTVAELFANGDSPEILFWVGCAGSFDDRAKKITGAFIRILNSIRVFVSDAGCEQYCLDEWIWY